MAKLLIGIDVGTSGTKTIIIDENGSIVRSKTVGYDTLVLKPGWSEMVVSKWWDAVVESLHSVLEGVDKSELKGLSFSGQMHGMVALDENNEVIRPAILWNDVRTMPQCEEITEKAGGLDGLLSYTNNQMLPGYTGGKILWMKQYEPENFARTKTIMLPKDYIRLMLTGLKMTEVSDASGLGFFDCKNRKYARELIEKVGLDPNLFPECVESTALTGCVTKEAAEITGLPEGLPVVGGGGDAVIQTTGTGLVKPGVVGVVIGTSGNVSMGLDKYYENKGGLLQMFCNNAPNLWHAFGSTLCSGGSYKWFKDNLANGISYDELNKLAEEAPLGCNGLFFLPYQAGERCPHNDPNARGTFIGLSLLSDMGSMARAVMEGVTFSLRSIIEIIAGLDPDIKVEKIIASGGATTSAFWRQLLADIFGVPVYTVSGATEGGAYGAALVAGVGVGVWPSVQDAISVLKEETVNYPNMENHEQYQKVYETYCSLYYTLKPAFDRIAEL